MPHPVPPLITIVGLGSLLSERSARTTFPALRNFRVGRIDGFRRVFAHPAAIFFERGIADLESLQIASLSAEECAGASFVCSLFEVEDEGMERFREREEEFELRHVPFTTLSASADGGEATEASATALMCLRSTDDAYVQLWGQERFVSPRHVFLACACASQASGRTSPPGRPRSAQDRLYRANGLPTIWGWRPDSGVRPCQVYLRHCVLAAERVGELCHASFLDDTFLIDRTTTLRSYLVANPSVMTTLPPPTLAERYGG